MARQAGPQQQRPIGFWLSLVERMIDERFAATLEEHGVTRRQWNLLSALSRGPATIEELDAALLPFEPAEGESAADNLTELIDSGWVDATPTGYEITERGTVAFTRLADVVRAGRELAVEGISEATYDSMVATLERIAFNLGWREN
jgi:hypothetical protein